MQIENTTESINFKGLLFDLTIYLAVMFLVREVYFSEIGFIANGLLWSLSTLVVAAWRMQVRKVSWKDLGLCRPKSIGKAFGVAALILVAVVLSIIFLSILIDQLPIDIAEDTSSESAASKFGDLKGNWGLFFSIIFFIWLESFLEEVLDRGFLMNWLEKLFSKSAFATYFAVLLQALIFGFRHSYDISERSLSVFAIGLVMGIAYVLFGRNLWPLIIAHIALNTISMVERV